MNSMKVPFSNRYNSFDGLRTLAAIGIAMMHYLANIDCNVACSLKKDCIIYSHIIPFFTTFVFMFFILSAFSMCCGYFHQFEVQEGKSEFNTSRFYSKRYSRILPFFALLVFLDFVMKPSKEELYQCIADITLTFNLLPNPDIHVIGVGWFLGVIFLFYMIFPWFVYLLQNKYRAWIGMGLALLMHYLTVNYFLTDRFVLLSEISNFRHNIVWSFPYFMIGGIIYLYKDILALDKLKLVWLFLAVVLTIFQFIYHPVVLGDNNMFLLIVFSLWIMYAMTGGISYHGVKFLDNKCMRFLGGLSMEIYLCHMVMFRFVEKLHLETIIDNVHAYYWCTCFIGIVLAILFSWFIKYRLFVFLGNNIPYLSFLRQ